MAKTKNNKEIRLSVLDKEKKLINKAEATLQDIQNSSKHEGIISIVFKRIAISLATIIALAGGSYVAYNHTIPTVESPQLAFSGEWYETNADGTFTGFFEDGKYNGFGTYEFLTGETYSGNWENDHYSGGGKMIYPNYGTYEGNYENGVRSGEGTFTWNNGDVYTGQWSNDKINGSGTITYANGVTISGTFVDNYIAELETDVPVGETVGQLQIANGESQLTFSQNGASYSVTLDESGNVSGQSTITYQNGDKYVGSIKAGKKLNGTYYFANGDQFTGSFMNDKMSSGSYFFKNGNKLSKCSFNDGVLEGSVTYVVNSKEYETTWSNGRCTSIKKA